jgi:biopolymer transport protein ExbB/TolQ/biopolymer transport protein ExbD
VWRSSDWVERGIFIALALMLAYTVFVLLRFSRRYYLARGESRAFEPDSWRAVQRSQRTLVADLSRGLRPLKAIASAAPFLGLAGTSYWILGGLFFGYSGSPTRFFDLIEARTASSLLTAATAILVAIPAILSHSFLRTRVDRFEREFSGTVPAAIVPHEDEASPRPFRRAQTLPLKKRFSALPPFALIAVPALASVVAMFMSLEPYERPTGLGVRLLPIGSLDGDRTNKPVVISVIAGADGSLVILVNSRETPPNNLEEATRRELKLLAEPQAYVEADGSLPWGDVANVIDRVESLQCEVILLTTTPGRDAECGWPRSPLDSHCRP